MRQDGPRFHDILLYMTKLLEQAVAKARELPEAEQNAIAQIVLDEIASETKWDELFARSPETLRKLADKAWAEHEAGKSEELNPDRGPREPAPIFDGI